MVEALENSGLSQSDCITFNKILIEAQQGKHGSLSQLYDYFQDIIMCMPNLVYWFDTNCLTVGCNQNILNFFGMSHVKQFQGLSFDDMSRIAGWTNAQGEKFEKDTNDVLSTGIPICNAEEPPVPSPDGSYAYYLTSRVPLFGSDGAVIVWWVFQWISVSANSMKKPCLRLKLRLTM